MGLSAISNELANEQNHIVGNKFPAAIRRGARRP